MRKEAEKHFSYSNELGLHLDNVDDILSFTSYNMILLEYVNKIGKIIFTCLKYENSLWMYLALIINQRAIFKMLCKVI